MNATGELAPSEKRLLVALARHGEQFTRTATLAAEAGVTTHSVEKIVTIIRNHYGHRAIESRHRGGYRIAPAVIEEASRR